MACLRVGLLQQGDRVSRGRGKPLVQALLPETAPNLRLLLALQGQEHALLKAFLVADPGHQKVAPQDLRGPLQDDVGFAGAEDGGDEDLGGPGPGRPEAHLFPGQEISRECHPPGLEPVQGFLQGLAPDLVPGLAEERRQQRRDGRMIQGPQGRHEVGVPVRVPLIGSDQGLEGGRLDFRLQSPHHPGHLAFQPGPGLRVQGRRIGAAPGLGPFPGPHQDLAGGPNSMATSSGRPISVR